MGALSFECACGSSRSTPAFLKVYLLCFLRACAEGSLVETQSLSWVNQRPLLSLPLDLVLSTLPFLRMSSVPAKGAL